MFSEPSVKPSTSMVLSFVKKSFDENEIRKLFYECGDIERVVYHSFGPDLFLNKVTVVFSDDETRKKVAAKFFGRIVGDNMSIQYSIRPFDQSLKEKTGQINMRKALDDVDIPNEFYDDDVFSNEWAELTSFPTNIDKGKAKVCLRYNLIKSLSNINFDFVTYLNLKGNDIKSINNDVKFSNLTFCDLSYNKLNQTPSFKNFSPSLEILYLNNNELESIEKNIIDLPLKKLYAAENKLKYVPMLPSTLEIIDFQYNFIENIDEFKANNLLSFNLSYNRLKFLPKFLSYVSPENITEIQFTHNIISNIDFSLLHKNIQKLDLSFNEISKIPEELFSNFSNLQSLDLSNNKIHNVPDKFSTSNLRSFNISFNSLANIPPIPTSLSDFRASSCSLSDITSTILDDNKIIMLFIDNNNVYKLPKLPFIEILFASNNKLTKFPYISPPQGSTLIVDVSRNQIEGDISSDIEPLVKNSPTFSLLDLSHNKITKVPDSIYTKNSQIKLSHNPNMNGVITIEQTKNINSIDISHTKIQVNSDSIQSHDLREIVTNDSIEINREYLSTLTIPFTKNLVFQYNDNDRVSFSEMLGDRSSMEDALIIRENYFDDNNEKADLFCVFDGHGGTNAARFAAYGIPSIISPNVPKNKRGQALIDVAHHLNDILISTNEKSGTMFLGAILDQNNKTINVVNLGDSRCLIVSENNEIRFSTLDDRVKMRNELERLRSEKVPCRKMLAGGYIGASGSIGDNTTPGVKHTPSLQEYKIKDDDKWLVLSCDGVYEELTYDDVAFLLSKCQSSSQAATIIRNYSYERRSGDNISVIVINLKK